MDPLTLSLLAGMFTAYVAAPADRRTLVGSRALRGGLQGMFNGKGHRGKSFMNGWRSHGARARKDRAIGRDPWSRFVIGTGRKAGRFARAVMNGGRRIGGAARGATRGLSSLGGNPTRAYGWGDVVAARMDAWISRRAARAADWIRAHRRTPAETVTDTQDDDPQMSAQPAAADPDPTPTGGVRVPTTEDTTTDSGTEDAPSSTTGTTDPRKDQPDMAPTLTAAEFNTIGDLEAYLMNLRNQVASVADQVARPRRAIGALPEAYEAAPFGTKALDDAVAGIADMAADFTALENITVALGEAITASIGHVRRAAAVGEVASEIGARGNVDSYKAA